MSAQCPICDAAVSLPKDVEISEVHNCNDCGSQVVVEQITNNAAVLAQAPTIEEDWGE